MLLASNASNSKAPHARDRAAVARHYGPLLSPDSDLEILVSLRHMRLSLDRKLYSMGREGTRKIEIHGPVLSEEPLECSGRLEFFSLAFVITASYAGSVYQPFHVTCSTIRD